MAPLAVRVAKADAEGLMVVASEVVGQWGKGSQAGG